MRFLYLAAMVNIPTWKLDIVGYLIFTNLLANYTKNNFVEYRKFILF